MERLFRFLTHFTLRHFLPERNYRRNMKAALPGGMINGQGIHDVKHLHYGFARFSHVGCEIIAFFNAMRLIGRKEEMPELALEFEKSGAQMMFGFFGTAPFAFEHLLGVRQIPFLCFKSQRALAEWCRQEGTGIFMLSFWNRRNIFHGYHTVAVKFDARKDEPFEVFNRYDNVGTTERYHSLDAVMGEGRFITAYAIIDYKKSIE